MRLRGIHFLLPILPLLAFACEQSTNDDTPASSTGGSNATGGSSAAGGSSATGGQGGMGGSDPETDVSLIDDFEDGNSLSNIPSQWLIYTDQGASGASVVSGPQGSSSFVAAPGRESSYAASLEFTLARGDYQYEPFVGIGVPISAAANAPSYEGISYWYKGAAHVVRFETSNITDYDFHVMRVPAAASWTKVTIPFAALAQEGFGSVVAWDPKLLNVIKWHVVGADGTTGSFALDDVRFETSAPVDHGPKNLTVKPAAPPVKVVMGDITIDTPLQKKALSQLDRGYNLTNWLEEGRFQSFEFDETYVENLAKAGFKALRLPIDLDQYVTDASGTGDEVALTIHDDLWTILDNFEEWTDAHGLSLTIDYHQYDKSFAFSDTAGVDQAVGLWRAVAAHFKDNARDDIYFELLNEPELSTGASNILPASAWTPVAQRMIDAIRGEDTTHTIIFGDVNWYGIDQLTARTPFSDDNIVYSFHSYDPFIFTHQGADWAQQSTTHDVPFPYAPERWSEYGSDLGLTAAQPAWIWDQFQNYNVNGTVEALYNRVAQAKAWAVQHQVPIICNEFGVYERKARLEDRVAYYSSLIGTFNELEIPWQVWFMIMDQNGTVIPEYVEAFRLKE